jgi:signal transduction histidine kinase
VRSVIHRPGMSKVRPLSIDLCSWYGVRFAGIILLCSIGSAVWVWFAARASRLRAHRYAEERIRIAHECCDSLLQELQGLLLSFHAAAQKVPPAHESKRELEQALASTDRVIVGARDRITRL